MNKPDQDIFLMISKTDQLKFISVIARFVRNRIHYIEIHLSMMTSSNGNIFPCYWPFVQGIHRSPVNSPHESPWHGASMFSLIFALNKRLSEAGDLRRHRANYDVIVMGIWWYTWSLVFRLTRYFETSKIVYIMFLAYRHPKRVLIVYEYNETKDRLRPTFNTLTTFYMVPSRAIYGVSLDVLRRPMPKR